MDTMTFTKAGGAFCGALLIFLLGAWGAESLYHVGSDGHGEDHAMGYEIEVASAEDDAAPAEAEPEIPFEEVFVNASAADGEGLWRQCAACHKLEQGENGTGPYLYGVVGREIGAAEGYSYSDALAGKGEAWTPENLNGFLLNPKEWAPGTKMAYRGMSDIEDRANLIAYLETIGG
ncbi:c-type cytochrome [Jannaschia ovalis]|uniref:Cytochrome c family protein n=1 Tax=Jannaschia ovalis TaxID=3038773 RepID=A0ABY8LE98_9RHOB|nr:cytochrome c family protein [Jannaschia sp. GRR-S6-38]WGH79486.1 cytochrome c family protein [Jannaschia sp. GRR-S6-38]